MVLNRFKMTHFVLRIITGKSIMVVLVLTLVLPLKSQTKPDGSAPQFLFQDYSISKVRMKNGQNQTLILNYNTVSEKMVYQKDGNLYDMVNPQMVDTIFLQDCKFVPAGSVFYEVLLTAPISLFVQYKGELIPPGAPAGYGVNSQVSNTKMMNSVDLAGGHYNLKLPEDFKVKVDPVYWIRRGSEMFNFMNERQFLKLFPDKETEFKKFIKQNRIKIDKHADLVKLIRFCNELLNQN